MLVTKASGLTEEYSDDKIVKSLQTASIPQEVITEVLADLHQYLTPGVSTADIYRRVNDFLQVRSLFRFSYNYDLKRAIMRLGPTGYPFEQFVARILSTQGYAVSVGQILQGKCLAHEVDIDANRESIHYLIECKFHNQPGTKTDIQVVLYTQARFMDIQEGLKDARSGETIIPWLITNTKVSKDAIDYAICKSLRLTSWSYPDQGCLREMIISSGLHPITCLSSLKEDQIYSLLHKNIVTCTDLEAGLKSNALEDIISEDQRHQVSKELKLFAEG